MRLVFSMIGKRITQLLIMFLLLSFITFVLMKLTPGDPVRTILNVEDVSTTTAQEELIKQQYGFDRPILIQYGEWLSNVVQLDLGESIIAKQPVLQLIINRLPASVALTIGGLVALLVIAVPFSVLAAIYENKWPDYLCRGVAIIGASIPSFWLGLLLIFFFSLQLNLLPVMGRGTLAHYILPSVTLGMAMAPVYIKLLREQLIDILQSSYIESAIARGIPRWRILLFHAIRGSLIPLVTMFGLSIGSLLGGITVIEMLFSWPGMGELIVNAVTQRDYPLIQGYIIVVGSLVVFINLLVDLITMLINPQIMQEARRAQ
ncbi:peptide/nickel transport system permease protein [Natronobacillus azotifigens]|uniref:Nickel import system permease protein NikB n=1 Tax=Natronobacillus azotifigens TaxID=472978 RepID=A0A9J6RCJ3_9BACI|nr:nickel ABC transporter permease [Natronobacillus azotifigens]MCZ0703078.1 ABC transporter permease [Natronobacillus azotifigens]